MFGIITLFGFAGTKLIATPIASIPKNLLNKAPLLKTIYSSVKDLMNTFVGKKKGFSEPVLVKVYENSQINSWKKINNKIECFTKKNKITTKKIIFCTNGFLKSLKVKKNYSFPITLTASLTRKLTDKEFKDIGSPKEWGVLPIRPMGATIRMTKDRRILIRNTAELRNPFSMSRNELNKRVAIHKKGIKKRFKQLPDNLIESSWSGIVCRSGNSSQIFEKIDDNIFSAGCYNGSGIGVGTLFGEQIALMASNQQSNEIEVIQQRKKPNWLPPQPFLNLGIYLSLIHI